MGCLLRFHWCFAALLATSHIFGHIATQKIDTALRKLAAPEYGRVTFYLFFHPGFMPTRINITNYFEAVQSFERVQKTVNVSKL
jgi:hypothetical protein